MLSFRLPSTLAALIILSGAAQAQTPASPAATDPSSQYGWLEGTITNSDGRPISGQMYTNASMHIKGVRQGGGQFDADSDQSLGGLYSAKNIRPGIYDLTLTTGFVGNTSYCPERIFGVIVKPGERAVLRIVMDQGDTYEEIGKPAVVSAPATNVTDELARMQKQIDDLKQQVAALLKSTTQTSTPAVTAKP